MFRDGVDGLVIEEYSIGGREHEWADMISLYLLFYFILTLIPYLQTVGANWE